jgi:hypothetical protein
MFLHELNDSQREGFMCLAARMASADAHLPDQELALLSQMRHEMDIPASWRPSSATTAELLARFTDHRSRTIVLLELLRLARVDTAIADRERQFFIEAATAFGFNRPQVQALLQWIRRHEALMADAEALLLPPISRIKLPEPPRADA